MTNIIDDPVFGKLEYKHSWTKSEIIKWHKQDVKVNITAQAYKGDSVLKTQRDLYLFFKNNKAKLLKMVINAIRDYYQETLGQKSLTIDEILSHLKPKTVLFERNKTWGILFDTETDIENGLAAFFEGEKISIGAQELFL